MRLLIALCPNLAEAEKKEEAAVEDKPVEAAEKQEEAPKQEPAAAAVAADAVPAAVGASTAAQRHFFSNGKKFGISSSALLLRF